MRAQGTVGVCECVLVRGRAKKTCRGVESGVIPALFKTTCQHGIRPGLLRWRPRSSASAVGLTASAAAAQLPGIPLLFLNRISEDFFFFLTRKETWKQTFGIVILMLLLLPGAAPASCGV